MLPLGGGGEFALLSVGEKGGKITDRVSATYGPTLFGVATGGTFCGVYPIRWLPMRESIVSIWCNFVFLSTASLSSRSSGLPRRQAPSNGSHRSRNNCPDPPRFSRLHFDTSCKYRRHAAPEQSPSRHCACAVCVHCLRHRNFPPMGKRRRLSGRNDDGTSRK